MEVIYFSSHAQLCRYKSFFCRWFYQSNYQFYRYPWFAVHRIYCQYDLTIMAVVRLIESRKKKLPLVRSVELRDRSTGNLWFFHCYLFIACYSGAARGGMFSHDEIGANIYCHYTRTTSLPQKMCQFLLKLHKGFVPILLRIVPTRSQMNKGMSLCKKTSNILEYEENISNSSFSFKGQ